MEAFPMSVRLSDGQKLVKGIAALYNSCFSPSLGSEGRHQKSASAKAGRVDLSSIALYLLHVCVLLWR